MSIVRTVRVRGKSRKLARANYPAGGTSFVHPLDTLALMVLEAVLNAERDVLHVFFTGVLDTVRLEHGGGYL
jgi:hypothetical protein